METPSVKAQRLLEELAKTRAGLADKVPDGYYDVHGWMKLWNMQRSQVRLNLQTLVKRKKLNAVRLRVFRGGKIVGVTFYG